MAAAGVIVGVVGESDSRGRFFAAAVVIIGAALAVRLMVKNQPDLRAAAAGDMRSRQPRRPTRNHVVGSAAVEHRSRQLLRHRGEANLGGNLHAMLLISAALLIGGPGIARAIRSARAATAAPPGPSPGTAATTDRGALTAQWRKWRWPVKTMAMPCSSAAAMTSASRTLPPG